MTRALFVLLALLATVAPMHAQEPQARAEAEPSQTHPSDDTKFRVMLGGYVVAATTDTAVSMYHIGNGTVRERGFGAPWQDSPVAFALTKTAFTVFFAYQLERLHRTHPKAAFTLGIVATSVEATLVARTAYLAHQHP